MSTTDLAKELGKRWEQCVDKTPYEEQAKKDKARYQVELAEYKKSKALADETPTPEKKAKLEEGASDEEEEEEEESE